MKNLSLLLRRLGRSNSASRRRRGSQLERAVRRQLSSEALERRQLLAGDLLLAHNYANPSDVNADERVTAIDALTVINHLSRERDSSISASVNTLTSSSSSLVSGESLPEAYLDVNADGHVSPIDALQVINTLVAEQENHPLTELQVSPRLGSTIGLENNNEATVSVGQIFDLEVAYADLRLEVPATDSNGDPILDNDGNPVMRAATPSDRGALRVKVDIPIGGQNGTNANAVSPLITDARQFLIGGEIRGSGSQLLFGRGQQNTLVSSADFVNDPVGSVESALTALGFDSASFTVSQYEAPDSNDFLIQARFDSVGVDQITAFGIGGSPTPSVEVIEYGPEPQSFVVNTAPQQGLSLALDAASRSLGNQVVYETFAEGTFRPDEGFDEVGAIALLLASDISLDAGEAFVAFSIPVFINRPVVDLPIEIAPAEDPEAIALKTPLEQVPVVPPDQIQVDEDGRFVITAVGDAGENTPPSFTGDITGPPIDDNDDVVTITESDLLAGAVDAEGDPISVVDLTPVSGDASGISVVGQNSLSINPSVYDPLQVGESATVVYAYNISDGVAQSPERRVTITIDGANDAPVANDTSVNVAENLTVEVDLSTLASDVEDDTLTFIAGALAPTNGSVQFNGSTVVYDPAVAGPSSDEFSYIVQDGNGGSAEATITVTVTEVNDPPQVGDPITETFTEDDTASSVELLDGATDPDDDDSSLTVENLTRTSPAGSDAGVVFDDVNDTLEVTPNAYNGLAVGESETVTYTYDVADPRGASTPQSVTITITGLNDPPTATGTTVSVAENLSREVDLATLASDVDGDTLTFSLDDTANTQTTGTLELNGSVVTYTPNVTGPATDAFSFLVDDGNGGSAGATVEVDITEINDPPEVQAPITETFSEDDASATVDLLEGATDPEGDTLSVTDFASTGGDASGITFNAATNELEVDPNAYNSLGAGEDEVVTFSYLVNDGRGGTVSQSATITITGVNDAPTAVEDTATTDEDTPVDIDVLANDSDPEDDSLTPSLGSVAPTLGVVAVNPDGTIRYTPNPDAFGEDTFSYTVSDGDLSSNEAMVTVTINPINDAPTVTGPVTATLSEDDASASVDLLAGASDVDNEDSELSVSTPVLTGGNDAGISFDSDANQLNVDPSVYNALGANESETVTFTYEVLDGVGGSVAQSATVTINGLNDAPTANDDSATTLKNLPVTVDVLENDTDPDLNDTLEVAETTAPANGSLTINTDGTITYTPDADFTGNDSFTYTATDGTAESVATVNVTVNDFLPSTVSGSIFFDNIENLDDYLNGADPVRNGIFEDDESGLGSVPVMLVSDANENVTGEAVERMVMTDLHGNYVFNNVAPGTYRVVYDVPDTIVFGANADGSSTPGIMEFSIDAAGGATLDEMNFTLIDTIGSALGNIDLLSSTYLRSNPDALEIDEDGRQGGLVSLSDTGEQLFFKAEQGFDDVKFAELALNDSRDAALLTIMNESGAVQTALLSADKFVVSKDGTAVHFFGGVEDFEFMSSPSPQLTQDFDDYRNAIDQIIGDFELT